MSSSDEEEFQADTDDEPLSSLKEKRPKGRPKIADSDDDDDGIDDDGGSDGEGDYEEEGEMDDGFDDKDDDDEVIRPSLTRKRSATASVNYNEGSDGDDDDDEDDIPLSKLKGSRPKKAKAAAPAKKKSPTKKSPAKKSSSPKKTRKAESIASTSSSSNNFQSASAALYGTDCEKGKLVQQLLRRWWYCMEWPDPALIPDEPPANHDTLDGFPGVYVCTAGDNVGQIMDRRNMEDCPNFNNFAKKPSAELQQLLLKALEEQKRQLVAADGANTPTEKELDQLVKWATKVKPSSADKEAEKVLKGAKMTLA